MSQIKNMQSFTSNQKFSSVLGVTGPFSVTGSTGPSSVTGSTGPSSILQCKAKTDGAAIPPTEYSKN